MILNRSSSENQRKNSSVDCEQEQFGNVYITEGGNLKQRNIIHLVVPVYEEGSKKEKKILVKAFWRALKKSQEISAKRIVFSDFCCGCFGYPILIFLQCALKAIDKYLKSHEETCIKEIIFAHKEKDTVFYFKRSKNSIYSFKTKNTKF